MTTLVGDPTGLDVPEFTPRVGGTALPGPAPPVAFGDPRGAETTALPGPTVTNALVNTGSPGRNPVNLGRYPDMWARHNYTPTADDLAWLDNRWGSRAAWQGRATAPVGNVTASTSSPSRVATSPTMSVNSLNFSDPALRDAIPDTGSRGVYLMNPRTGQIVESSSHADISNREANGWSVINPQTNSPLATQSAYGGTLYQDPQTGNAVTLNELLGIPATPEQEAAFASLGGRNLFNPVNPPNTNTPSGANPNVDLSSNQSAFPRGEGNLDIEALLRDDADVTPEDLALTISQRNFRRSDDVGQNLLLWALQQSQNLSNRYDTQYGRQQELIERLLGPIEGGLNRGLNTSGMPEGYEWAVSEMLGPNSGALPPELQAALSRQLGAFDESTGLSAAGQAALGRQLESGIPERFRQSQSALQTALLRSGAAGAAGGRPADSSAVVRGLAPLLGARDQALEAAQTQGILANENQMLQTLLANRGFASNALGGGLNYAANAANTRANTLGNALSFLNNDRTRQANLVNSGTNLLSALAGATDPTALLSGSLAARGLGNDAFANQTGAEAIPAQVLSALLAPERTGGIWEALIGAGGSLGSTLLGV